MDGVEPLGAIAESGRPSLYENHEEALRRGKEEFQAWFSVNLQHIINNPKRYSQLQTVSPSKESKKIARSYINRVTGKYQYDCARAICAAALTYTLYSHYSQSCALPMITQGNYSHNIGESSNCKITPDVFPVLYAIAGGSVTGVFNAGLNYYNTNWSQLGENLVDTYKEFRNTHFSFSQISKSSFVPYVVLLCSYVVAITCYNKDTHHLVSPVVYPICGGLTLSFLLDLIKIFFTIPPKPNSIKRSLQIL